MPVSLNGIYIPSDEIVARVIEDELIIVPLAAGIGDMEDELYSLNETGRDIWDRLDGRCTLSEVVQGLAEEYDAQPGEIEQDVLGLVEELFRRKMLVEVGDCD